jgi:hypothetical protein
MTNANDTIVQTVYRQIGDTEYRIATPKDIKEGIYLHTTPGLTKREYFAAMAMQGYCGGEFIGQSGMPQETIAEWCTKMADALIEQLNKQP